MMAARVEIPWTRRAALRRLGLLAAGAGIFAAFRPPRAGGPCPPATPPGSPPPFRLRVRPLDLRALDAPHDLAG